MCDKAYDRTRKELKEAMDVIKDTEGSANTGRAISIYNAKVIGIHQYFQLATMISEDVSKISYEIQHKCKSRKLERRIERTGRTKQGYIEKIYGASKQLRYINEVAIAPIGYCKHKNPMYKKKKYNNLVIVEREVHTLIHAVDEEVIAKLLGKLSLDKKKLAKLNTLRTKSGNKAINW